MPSEMPKLDLQRNVRLASRKHLASIVAGKQVMIEYQKRDRYGRIVGKVWVSGIDVCLEQVKAGFAWHYKKYQHEPFCVHNTPSNSILSFNDN